RSFMVEPLFLRQESWSRRTALLSRPDGPGEPSYMKIFGYNTNVSPADNTMIKLNLKKFEKNLAVRPLRAADWESVVTLQQQCFPGMKDTWTREQFLSQLAMFPEGQIGVEYQGKLVASSSSLILYFELYKDY